MMMWRWTIWATNIDYITGLYMEYVEVIDYIDNIHKNESADQLSDIKNRRNSKTTTYSDH